MIDRSTLLLHFSIKRYIAFILHIAIVMAKGLQSLLLASSYLISYSVLPLFFATKRLAEANSVELKGAAPYLRGSRQYPLVVTHMKRRTAGRLPSNERHTHEGADAAEHKRNNASSREAGWQGCDLLVLTLQIQHVNGVACSVAGDWDATGTTDFEVVLRDGQGSLQLKRSFDQSCGQT